MTAWISVTCDLENESGEFGNGFGTGFDGTYAGTVVFDVTDTTADDTTEEVTMADYFNSVIGG